MDNLLYSHTNFPFKKLRLKKSKSKQYFGSLKNVLFPLGYNKNRISIKNIYDKSFIAKKLVQSSPKDKKDDSLSNKNSTINSISNSKVSSTDNNKNENTNFYNTSINLKYNDKKNSIKNNSNSEHFGKILIKAEQIKLSNCKKKKSQSLFIKNKKDILKTDNNQDLVYNNFKIKNNDEINKNKNKNDYHSKEDIEELKNKVNILCKKYHNIEDEKNEKEKKIEILEKKIDDLINFIKNNEILTLKDKVNSLEKTVNNLQLENKKLKKEILKKNHFCLNIKNNINKSLGQKKVKKKINLNNKNINTTTNINNNKESNKKINDLDMQKIKLISIDPDNF